MLVCRHVKIWLITPLVFRSLADLPPVSFTSWHVCPLTDLPLTLDTSPLLINYDVLSNLGPKVYGGLISLHE